MIARLFDTLLSPARKATTAAAMTGLAAALAAVLPFLDGPVGIAVFVALAVLGAFGATYSVPNVPPSLSRHAKNSVDGETVL